MSVSANNSSLDRALVAKRIGLLMQEGWRMMAVICPICNTCLMQKQPDMRCPGCDVPVLMQAASSSNSSSAASASASASYENDHAYEDIVDDEEDDDIESSTSSSVAAAYEKAKLSGTGMSSLAQTAITNHPTYSIADSTPVPHRSLEVSEY